MKGGMFIILGSFKGMTVGLVYVIIDFSFSTRKISLVLKPSSENPHSLPVDCGVCTQLGERERERGRN